jgi:hypothetical protein
MKRVLQTVVVAGLVLACSEEGERGRAQTAVAPAAAAGAGGVVGSAGSGGNEAGSGGAAGGAPASPTPTLNLGEPLELIAGTGDVPYAIGPNPYGIRGGGFLARSTLGNTITVRNEPNQICISGSLEEVPNGDYGRYWGVEIGFNLNQGEGGTPPPPDASGNPGVNPGAPSVPGSPPADAGNDAGDAGGIAPPAEVARPWLPGEVIGFSFVIEGPTINLIRFKGLPAGYDSALESSVFCKTVEAASGAPQSALFSELTQYCWSSQAVPIPTAGGLANISWQLPADVAPAGVRPFDWCLKDLRPILAPR